MTQRGEELKRPQTAAPYSEADDLAVAREAIGRCFMRCHHKHCGGRTKFSEYQIVIWRPRLRHGSRSIKMVIGAVVPSCPCPLKFSLLSSLFRILISE